MYLLYSVKIKGLFLFYFFQNNYLNESKNILTYLTLLQVKLVKFAIAHCKI